MILLSLFAPTRWYGGAGRMISTFAERCFRPEKLR